MEKTKWHIKAYHKFLIYLPVLLILSLILLIYFTYIFTYINVLINTPKELNPESFAFLHTLNPTNAYTKGIWLLYSSLFFVIMLILSILRTVFIEPGYFPSPMELEHKIINKNIRSENKEKEINNMKEGEFINLDEEDYEKAIVNNERKNKYEYLTKFKNVIINGPLTSQESVNIREKVSNYFNGRNMENESKALSNEEIFVLNKKKYSEQINVEKSNSNFCSSPNSDNLFLSIYSGIDLTKTNLCGVCLRVKVERSHHCRQCGRCILKMDHHCPWLANCIGFRNYKNFCLLHFYGLLTTTLISLTYCEVVINFNLNYDSDLFHCWFVCFIYICNVGFMFFLLWLFYVNFNLLFSGQTIIEQSDRERFPSSKSVNIYDIGWKRNFTNVFGSNPLVWLIPFYSNSKGNGFVFETNEFRID
jgi:hypothetical protein